MVGNAGEQWLSQHGELEVTESTYRRPKVLPHLSQLQANGFSLVCVLSCL